MKGLLIVLLISLLNGFLIIAVFSGTFYSPVLQGWSTNSIVSDNLPQGWAFFTKSPRDKRTLVFDENNVVLLKQNFSVEYWFGLSRIPRKICLEVGLAVTKLPDNSWARAKDVQDFRKDQPITYRKSFFKNPMLKGVITVANQERIPWAWASYVKKIHFPLTYTKVVIEDCND